jgi:hypothetical protein
MISATTIRKGLKHCPRVQNVLRRVSASLAESRLVRSLTKTPHRRCSDLPVASSISSVLLNHRHHAYYHENGKSDDADEKTFATKDW